MFFPVGVPGLPEGARRSEAIIWYEAQQAHGCDHGEGVFAGIFVGRWYFVRLLMKTTIE